MTHSEEVALWRATLELRDAVERLGKADSEDDHFYGAWSGGSKQEGGHPKGTPKTAQRPIDKWLQSLPDANRAQMRQWAETGSDVEARIARLPEGATPPLPDTLEAWQTTAFGEIRDSAAHGLSPDPPGQEIVSSWSSVEGFAASQGSDYLTGDLPVLVTFMANGARGIELARHIPDSSAEWVTAGRFVHDGAIRVGDELTVYLRYDAAFTTPAQYSGTR